MWKRGRRRQEEREVLGWRKFGALTLINDPDNAARPLDTSNTGTFAPFFDHFLKSHNNKDKCNMSWKDSAEFFASFNLSYFWRFFGVRLAKIRSRQLCAGGGYDVRGFIVPRLCEHVSLINGSGREELSPRPPCSTKNLDCNGGRDEFLNIFHWWIIANFTKSNHVPGSSTTNLKWIFQLKTSEASF